MAPTPMVKSFLIADTVIQDRGTGKWTVVGLFDQIYAPAFPCIHPSVAIYVRLTDAWGKYRVKIEFRDHEDNCVSTFQGINLEVSDRLQGVEFGLATQGMPLKKPGRYQFQLFLNDEYVASAPLHVIKIEKRKREEREEAE